MCIKNFSNNSLYKPNMVCILIDSIVIVFCFTVLIKKRSFFRMYSAQSALVIVKFYTKFSTESVETRPILVLFWAQLGVKSRQKCLGSVLFHRFLRLNSKTKTNFPILLLSCLSVLNH